ncbi:hypothetical protein Asppvi_010083 [Aspergillus pseudoviridinutans]|uniref:Fungal STAND N-terminal Goodbye domain-containing protein n=1 Tax=Aspergillus pseudoviridinutans TaxID=1517512 RepID=A0A9P3EZL4_9EURO|nr:uncharacterized protein Asppvi_010083 [Aspergillus pseudoviridinutans]GIJ91118.1 hypothetical protein Asppvi_010083 [Aspergillus pseudoviridinutans]
MLESTQLCIKERWGFDVIASAGSRSTHSKESPEFLCLKVRDRAPENLRRLLDAHYAAQADDKSVSKTKAMGFQMIHCIQLLGAIASQGASMAFAPTGLCFNALSFLLAIPKKVHGFHGEIDAIFGEVGPALAQFRIYERMDESSQIDEAL